MTLSCGFNTRVIQITDCHLFADNTRCGYQAINPFSSLGKVLSEVNRLKPDVVLATGDLSGDCSAASYRHFQTLWHQAGILAPLHIIPGNHDEPELLQQAFADELAWLDTPLVFNNWHLHGLDSHYQGTLGYVGGEQLARLEQRVSAAPGAHHLVAVHHHPIVCDSWMDKHQWLNRQDFLSLLEVLPQIKLVLHGHVHAALQWQYRQSTILASPSTCWQWQQTETFGVADQAPGLRLITLSDNGDFDTQIFRVSDECNR